MAGYNNQQPYGNWSFLPFAQPQQSPPATANSQYNAYSQQQPSGYAQQPQYSPTSQQMYGMEPTTPVLDENQMNWFWNNIHHGSIPGTFPPPQPQVQAFVPPQPQPQPQPPPPPPPPHFQYQQYGQQARPQGAQLQEPFQPHANSEYVQPQDVHMQGANEEDDSWPEEEDDDDYAPPDIAAPRNVNGANQPQSSLAVLSSVAQGKKPAASAHTQPAAPFNPFKSQSLHDAPPPLPQAQAAPKLNLALRNKAGEAIKDFRAHGLGYSALVQEPSFDDFDKHELRKLYDLYKIPQEPEKLLQPAEPESDEVRQARRIAALRQFFAGSGIEVDDATLLSLVDSALAAQAEARYPQPHLPELRKPQPSAVAVKQQPPQDVQPPPPNRSLSTSTPGGDAGTPSENRSAYLAKLKAMKGTSTVNQQQTSLPIPSAPALKPSGAGVVTPARRAQVNKEALQRKLQLQREAAAKKLADVAPRPALPERTDSMSSIQYDSGQASGQSASDAENTPIPDISSPEEGEMDEEADEEGLESGEIIEQSRKQASGLQPAASIPGLPAKPPDTARPIHVRNDSHPSATGSPRSAGLPARPPSARKPPPVYPPAVPDPSILQRYRAHDHLKRPASSAFGQTWNPQAKRPHPDTQNISDMPEPVVIDISSEEEGELTDDEDMEDVPPVAQHTLPDRPPPSGVTQPFTVFKSTGVPTSLPVSASVTPQGPATPDPIAAARRENLAAKRDALKKQIQLKEAAKNSMLSAGTSSPLPAAPVARLASSPVRSSSRLPSITRQQAVKSLEADIRTDEEALEEMQRQMEKMKQDLERKKTALKEEIMNLGGNEAELEGLSQRQLEEVRDDLVEQNAAIEAQMQEDQLQQEQKHDESSRLEGSTDDDEEDEEDEDEEDEESEDGSGSEEGEVEDSGEEEQSAEADEASGPRQSASGFLQALRGTQSEQTPMEEEIPDANDPLAAKSRARLELHLIPVAFDKVFIRNALRRYDITGITVRPLKRARSKQAKKRELAFAHVDFLYPAEAAEAYAEIKKHGLAGHMVRIGMPSGANSMDEEKDLQNMKKHANIESRAMYDETKAARKLAKQPKDVAPVAGSWGQRHVRLHATGLGDHLNSHKAIKGWMGRFYNQARNVTFPRSGEMMFELSDKNIADMAVQELSKLANTKKNKNMKISIVDSPVLRAQGQHDSQDAAPSRQQSAKSMQQSLRAPTASKQHKSRAEDQAQDDEDESSGSESDDEAESDGDYEAESDDDYVAEFDDDAMSVSDGEEPGQIPPADQRPSTTIQEATVNDQSDSMSESESESSSGSDNDEEAMGDVGVSLRDVEDAPMDEDSTSAGTSRRSSQSANSNASAPSDDEEVETEEADQHILPQEASENEDESESDEDQDGGVDKVQESIPYVAQAVETAGMAGTELEAHHGDAATASEPANEAVETIPEHAQISTAVVEQVIPEITQPMVASGSPSAHIQSQIAPEALLENEDTDMLDDENDDDFYEPTAAVSPVAQAQEPVGADVDASGDEDDYDPEFDAAFEEAFAEAGEVVSPAQDDGVLDVHANGTSTYEGANRDSETGADESAGGGIPGHYSNSDANGLVSGDNLVSEDGEILSDGKADNESDLESIKSVRVPEPESPIQYDVPMWRPLGTEPLLLNATDDQTTKRTAKISAFKPYVSVLKGFKAYRVHENLPKEVKGGVESLSYDHKIDPLQPLCPVEIAGDICEDRKHCPGQHLDDAVLSGE